MAARSQALSFQKFVKVKPALIYRAFTNSTSLREWFCDVATVDPKPGGRMYVAWSDGYYASGEYLETKPDKRVSFSWNGRGDPRASRVTVRLAKRDGGTLVSIEHSRLGVNQVWAPVVEEIKKGWTYALENLPSVMETGEDLRFTLRPMMGIIQDAFNAEIAGQLGVPVTEGMRLATLVEGMGAAAAGLQANDVVVSMDGIEYAQWGSVANILQPHRAGDRIDVGFYRGSEKKSVLMELSKRPLPDIPSQPELLAAELRQRDEKSISDLEGVFTGVSEEEAAHKPAEDEWSAKEVLAHLIHEVRGTLSFINDLRGGYEPLYDDYGPNSTCRISPRSLIPPYLACLENTGHVETASFIECLPDSQWRIKAVTGGLPTMPCCQTIISTCISIRSGCTADARKIRSARWPGGWPAAFPGLLISGRVRGCKSHRCPRCHTPPNRAEW
jgi:uncharacterized protein YndB with AHSA1/START domain